MITMKNINFALDILKYPQSGDESDIKKAFNTAIESLMYLKDIEFAEESEKEWVLVRDGINLISIERSE